MYKETFNSVIRATRVLFNLQTMDQRRAVCVCTQPASVHRIPIPQLSSQTKTIRFVSSLVSVNCPSHRWPLGGHLDSSWPFSNLGIDESAVVGRCDVCPIKLTSDCCLSGVTRQYFLYVHYKWPTAGICTYGKTWPTRVVWLLKVTVTRPQNTACVVAIPYGDN